MSKLQGTGQWPGGTRPTRRHSPETRPAISGQQSLDDLSMHIRQPAIDAIVPEGKLGVIEPELMQNRRMDVVHGRGMVAVERFVTP